MFASCAAVPCSPEEGVREEVRLLAHRLPGQLHELGLAHEAGGAGPHELIVPRTELERGRVRGTVAMTGTGACAKSILGACRMKVIKVVFRLVA